MCDMTITASAVCTIVNEYYNTTRHVLNFFRTDNFAFYSRIPRSTGVMTYPVVTFKLSVKHNPDRRDAVGLPMHYTVVIVMVMC